MHSIGRSWRMDETYIKIKGKWCYLYHAIDKSDDMIDLMLSKKRDKAAAKRFFIKAIGYSGRAEKITIDKNSADNATLKSINKRHIDSDRFLHWQHSCA